MISLEEIEKQLREEEYRDWLKAIKPGDWVAIEDEYDPTLPLSPVWIKDVSPIRIYSRLASFDRSTGYHLAGPWGDTFRLVKPNLPEAPEPKKIPAKEQFADLG